MGLKDSVLLLFTKIEMLEVEIQYIMSLVILVKKLKKWKACLIKDHSFLSKAFFRLIFRIMLALLPFILEK